MLSLKNTVKSLESKSLLHLTPSAGSTGPAGGASGQESGQGATPISCPVILADQSAKYRCLNFSVDTLLLNYSVSYDSFNLFEQLEKAKIEIQNGMEAEAPFSFTVSGLFAWNLQRTGRKYFQYVLRSGDMTLSLSNRSMMSSVPNLSLAIGSVSCNDDLTGKIRKFKLWLRHLGIKCHSEKISRVDICADFQLDINSENISDTDCYVTRAENISSYSSNRVFTGLQLGTGDIVARIYDKQRQMLDQRQLPKFRFFMDKWQLPEIQPVTRVEFQLRREAVKQFLKKGNFEYLSFARNMRSIWSYLACSWLRHCSEAPDRKNRHQDTAKTSEFWQSVQNACFTRSEKPVKPAKREKKHCFINVDDLRKQAAGILITCCVGLGQAADDFFGIIGTCKDIVMKDIKALLTSSDFQTVFLRKQLSAFAPV
jgi:hypothetical protein